MIRRKVGDEFWLITQNDHAAISGEFARQLELSAMAIEGISLHDSGWPLHDDSPTLNAEGLPLHVFETPREIALRVWEESVNRAAAQDAYAGLLVSLHSLSLSIFATENSIHQTWDIRQPRVRFEVNRFQHRMIEMQESLRKNLGLPNDQPLKNGLAENSDDPREKKLASDFRWLQALDQLSLVICCNDLPFKPMQQVRIEVTRANEKVELKPWPFAVQPIEVAVPFRRVGAKPFLSESDFRAVYAAAKIERFTATVRSHTM